MASASATRRLEDALSGCTASREPLRVAPHELELAALDELDRPRGDLRVDAAARAVRQLRERLAQRAVAAQGVRAGHLVEGVEACIASPDDEPLPDGEAGELLLRACEPLAFSTGYFGMTKRPKPDEIAGSTPATASCAMRTATTASSTG